MSKVNLLVIDDDPSMNRAVQEIIGYLGYVVRTTADAAEGQTLAVQLDPQMIVLSTQVGHSDGYEVCRRLRDDPRTAWIPVMLVGQHRPSEEFERETAVGANYFATKPFQANDLAADLYHLSQSEWNMPLAAQPTLRVTQIMPPQQVGATSAPAQPEPPVEEAPQPSPRNGNGREESEPEAEPRPGTRHQRRFAEMEAQAGPNNTQVLGELAAIRQTMMANAFRIKALVNVLEDAGVIQPGAVDRAMQQVMREGQHRGNLSNRR